MRVLVLFGALFGTMVGTSAAQAITRIDTDAARASLRAGYGGHGPDLDVSVDTRQLLGAVRFRAGVGHGRWVGINSEGTPPTVTRAAASALLYFRDLRDPTNIRPYVGIGVTALAARGIDLDRRLGTRLTAGLEYTGERWTIALPEVELDIPRENAADLFPTVRVGLAFRRRF